MVDGRSLEFFTRKNEKCPFPGFVLLVLMALCVVDVLLSW
jgi:hypothetical protein